MDSSLRATTGSIGIVTGLPAEARLLRGLAFRVAIGGGSPAGAEAAARRLVGDGALALVSFGLSGGLQPGLRPGEILIPGEIRLVSGERFPTEPALSRRLGGATTHVILGGDRVAGDPDEKLRLWRLTGAAAGDLESGAVASVAAEYGLPCAALRVICDPANRRLPPAALAALDHGGNIAIGAMLRALAADPWQITGLLALAADAFAARRALIRHVRALQPDGCGARSADRTAARRSAGEADKPAERGS